MSGKLKSLLRHGARLALFALLFQLAAVDHWQPRPSDIVGVEGSAEHVLHCHGAGGSCADSASLAIVGLPAGAVVPAPPLVYAQSLGDGLEAPPEVAPPSLDQPPRAA